MVRQSAKLRPVMTRIPEGLRRRLEKEAKQNRRSMNAEIIARLESSFRQQEQRELIHATVEETWLKLAASKFVDRCEKLVEQIAAERAKS